MQIEQNWIEKVKGLTNPVEIREVLDTLERNNKLALVSEYGKGQQEARLYLDRNEEIPTGLVTALQTLAGYGSGYTGLTIYQAYLEQLRQKS